MGVSDNHDLENSKMRKVVRWLLEWLNDPGKERKTRYMISAEAARCGN